MAYTPNFNLYLADDDQMTFYEWRQKLDGTTDSNMTKIDNALGDTVQVPGGATLVLDESFGDPPYTISFTNDDGDDLTNVVHVEGGATLIIDESYGEPPYTIVISDSGDDDGSGDGSSGGGSISYVASSGTATASGTNSFAGGPDAKACGHSSIAIGAHSQVNTSTDVNFRGMGGIAIGVGAKAVGASGMIAIGEYCKAGNDESSGMYAIAIGETSSAYAHAAIAVGHSARSNNYSIAIGSLANAYGDSSISIGYSNALGLNSVAIGTNSYAYTDYTTALGCEARSWGQYSTAIGYNAHVSSPNAIQLGDPSFLSHITARVGITVTSDERDKTDIKPIANATDFLKKVKAVTYVYNHREKYRPKEPELDDDGEPIIEDGVDYMTDEDRENLKKYGFCRYDKEAHAAGTKKGSRRRAGVIAQETQQALRDVYGDDSYANLVNDNLHDLEDVPDGIESTLAMNYEGFIPFLIEAVQELDARIEKQNKEIARLKDTIQQLKAGENDGNND